MHVTDNMEDFKPLSECCGILEPLNDTMKKLEQLFPVEMDEFKKDRHIKGSGPGGDYNGPTLKSIMANTNGKLDDIQEIVDEKATGGEHRFVEHIKNLHELNKSVNQKVLDLLKVKEIVAKLGDNFAHMQKEFDLSQTLKLHIILDHYVEHFEMTNESLLKYSDEICNSFAV